MPIFEAPTLLTESHCIPDGIPYKVFMSRINMKETIVAFFACKIFEGVGKSITILVYYLSCLLFSWGNSGDVVSQCDLLLLAVVCARLSRPSSNVGKQRPHSLS
jgi:hypothetical protein